MNWLTNYVRPKIQALVKPKDVSENLWHRCEKCELMIFHRDLERYLHVCNHCGNHMHLPPVRRLSSLFDDGEYVSITWPKSAPDPLKFRDSKKYTDRLKDAKAIAGDRDALMVGAGKINKKNTVIAVFDFKFMGGSMGVAVGSGIVAAAQHAINTASALIIIPSSGGARMQEGILSLMQMPRTIAAISQFKKKRLPYISLLTNPTTGGVAASFAMIGDITIAEPGAVIGFTGARVIQETIREKLPEGFQRSEYLLNHGMVDMVIDRRKLREEIGRVLEILMPNHGA